MKLHSRVPPAVLRPLPRESRDWSRVELPRESLAGVPKVHSRRPSLLVKHFSGRPRPINCPPKPNFQHCRNFLHPPDTATILPCHSHGQTRCARNLRPLFSSSRSPSLPSDPRRSIFSRPPCARTTSPWPFSTASRSAECPNCASLHAQALVP